MKLEIIITGKKVHDVGYRHFLLAHALMRGIEKLYSYNAYIEGKQTVMVYIEGEEEQVVDFLDLVKTNFPSDAKEVSYVKHNGYVGEVMDINQYMHLAHVEQLDKGIPAILEIREHTSQIPAIRENTEKILEHTKGILVKQDETIQEIKSLRLDLKSYMDTRFKEIFFEIGRIKEKIGLS